jgi:glycosyltransferase involved in cell wall biosynthesis
VESCEARAEGFWYYLFHRKPPLVIKLHTPESIIFRWNGEPYNWDNKIVEKLEEFWIFRADRLVAISKAMLNLISRYYKFKFKGVSVVPNPININLFKPDMNLNANNGNPIILYAGRLEFRKGVHILIRAMPAVLKEIPGARFFFIGSDCGMKGYLSRKISELGCSNNVEFIEQIKREELVDFYQKSTVCIVPSLWENYPYSCLESLACGKPLIISDTGGIPEIIKDKINGILVPPGSVSSLADAIVEILNNKKIQETLRCNARKCAEESYASEKIAHKTLNIYKELIN